MKDLDISNIESKPTTTKRDRTPIERKKYGEIVAERDKYQESAQINGKAAHNLLRDYERVLIDLGKVTAERDRLKAENEELRKDNEIWRKAGRGTEEQKKEAIALVESKAAEHDQLDTLARNLRHQLDMARFLAAMVSDSLHSGSPWLFGWVGWFRLVNVKALAK